MNMDVFRIRIKKIEIAGIGEIYVKRPSAGLARRVTEIQSSVVSEQTKGFNYIAELIASCWVDKDGHRMIPNSDAAFDMESEAFTAIGTAIIDAVRNPSAVEPEKNSQDIPIGSSPIV